MRRTPAGIYFPFRNRTGKRLRGTSGDPPHFYSCGKPDPLSAAPVIPSDEFLLLLLLLLFLLLTSWSWEKQPCSSTCFPPDLFLRGSFHTGISPGQAQNFCLSLWKRPFPVFFPSVPKNPHWEFVGCGRRGNKGKSRDVLVTSQTGDFFWMLPKN